MLLRRHCFYENRVFVSLVCCCALDNKPNGIKNRTQMVEPSLSFIRSDFFCYFQLHRKLIAVQNHFITVYIPVPFARAAATFAQPMHSRVLYKMQLQIVQTTFGRCGQNEYFSHTYENILFHLVAPTFISRSFFFSFSLHFVSLDCLAILQIAYDFRRKHSVVPHSIRDNSRIEKSLRRERGKQTDHRMTFVFRWQANKKVFHSSRYGRE